MGWNLKYVKYVGPKKPKIYEQRLISKINLKDRIVISHSCPLSPRRALFSPFGQMRTEADSMAGESDSLRKLIRRQRRLPASASVSRGDEHIWSASAICGPTPRSAGAAPGLYHATLVNFKLSKLTLCPKDVNVHLK